jgi:hypothetical protein
MQFRFSNSVRAFLPVAVLAFSACGGGGGAGKGTLASSPPGAPSPAPAPAPAPASANQAPTISGDANAYAPIGRSYEFQPSAQDPDGDTLRFSATNLPPWASIDTASGRITGTPTDGDLGEYEDITIAVADASHQAVTSPFSITVLSGATGIATLHWEQPPAKVDGSPLDDLAGYRIIYGRAADDLDHSVFIGDPAQTAYEFTTLAPGIWYFAVIGVNASGLEGPPTTAATKSI